MIVLTAIPPKIKPYCITFIYMLKNAQNRPKHKKSGIIQKALRRDIIDLWPQIQDKKFIPSPKVSNCSIIL